MKIRMNRQHLDYLTGETYDVEDSNAELWVAHGLATALSPTSEQQAHVDEIKAERKPNKK